jgi:hypothetical protein
MSGYLSFKYTGNAHIDDVLGAVERAGDLFHHTSQWQDPEDFIDGGKSCVELIEETARESAKALADSPKRKLAKHRVSLFLTEFSKRRGLRPEIIMALGMSDGELELLVSDLKELL